jgi:hypothetical protein
MRSFSRLLDHNNAYSKETALRDYFLKNDIRQTRKVILLLTIPFLAFIVNDYMFYGFTAIFWLLCSLRFVLVFLIGLSWLKLGTVNNHKTYDKIMFSIILAAILIGGVINSTRPDNFVNIRFLRLYPFLSST